LKFKISHTHDFLLSKKAEVFTTKFTTISTSAFTQFNKVIKNFTNYYDIYKQSVNIFDTTMKNAHNYDYVDLENE